MTDKVPPEGANPGEEIAGAPHAAPAHTFSPGYVRYAIGLLTVVYIFNFLDRQVLNILAEDIKLDLKITDGQFGLLAGAAFAFIYTFMGIPIARLAERKNRTVIISASLAVWSGFTTLSGTVTAFWQLVIYRFGVGIGEAGGTPPAHSLITDYVPKEKRASALAFYSMGVPIGSFIGLAMGGMVADALGWKAAFFVAGAPGLILAALAFFTLKETRAKLTKDAQRLKDAAAKTTIWKVIAFLWARPTFLLIGFAASLKAFIGYGQGSFHTQFYLRNHGEEVHQLAESFGLGDRGFLGWTLGLLVGVFGVTSTLLGGWIADKTGKKDARNTLIAPALAVLLTVPIYMLAMTVDSAVLSFTLLIIPYLFNYFWYGPVYSATQGLVPPHMRATAAAILLFIINFVGMGFGPTLVGYISDWFASGQLDAVGQTVEACKASRYKLEGCAPAAAFGVQHSLFYSSMLGLPSCILFLLARRTINRDLQS